MATTIVSVEQPHKRSRPFGRIIDPPPLVNGDRLTRTEFERRYRAMPPVKRAELIEGVVFMPSPVRFQHAEPHGYLMTWLGTYRAATAGVRLLDNATVRLDADNEVQPDALLRIEPAAGGHSRVADDDYLEGAPELIGEVALSSAAYDLRDKLNVYRRNGVQEYIVWQVLDERIDWFELREGAYVSRLPDGNGVIHSQVFPGLSLSVEKMLDGDLAGVLAELSLGLGTPEHQALIERLA